MHKRFSPFAAIGLSIALVASSAISATDNGTRPAADIERDASRKPADMVTFAKIEPGQTVVDMLPGGGYFTRIVSQAVGPEGHVIALVSDVYAAANPKARTDIRSSPQNPLIKMSRRRSAAWAMWPLPEPPTGCGPRKIITICTAPKSRQGPSVLSIKRSLQR